MLSALTVPMAIASVPAGWLTVRFGYRKPAVSGILLAILGFILMISWQIDTPYLSMIPHLLLAGIGFGLVMAPITAAAINAAPASDRGTASSMVIIFRLIGMTVSVSSVATYGVQRANILSEKWLGASNEINDIIEIGMQVAERVISETFIIATVVAILGIIPILLIKNKNKGENYGRQHNERK